MENQSDISQETVVAPVEQQPTITEPKLPKESKKNIWTIIGVAIILLLITTTALFAYQYYELKQALTNSKLSPNNPSLLKSKDEQKSELELSTSPSVSINSKKEKELSNSSGDWKMVQIEKHTITMYAGDRVYIVDLKIPKDWSIQKTNKRSGDGIGGTDCYDYLIKNSDNSIDLFLKPSCGAVSGSYKPFPPDGVVIKMENHTGVDGHDSYIIRYYDTKVGLYRFVDVGVERGQVLDKSKHKASNVVIINSFDEHHGVWLSVEVDYSGSHEAFDFVTIDEIIKSLEYRDY